ncbi:MAG: autotransporter-associated beta strand repeat-containing protein, partial [Prosthecobacter sp.]|nr:autotransporter-associated beta strand repeat-containing protein [Prosthecobacter sp.]
MTWLILTQPTFSQTATWLNAATNSSWGTASNWADGYIPHGVDQIADFSTVNIESNRTVNLVGNRLVGSLIFGDAETASNNWILANGAGGPWSLTLATSEGIPEIRVVNQVATISALLAGTQGLSKTGAGTLTLSNAGNTLTGGITLQAGTLNFSQGALGENQVTFAANAALAWSAGNAQDISAQLMIGEGVTATLATGANNLVFASAMQTSSSTLASVIKTGAGSLTFTAPNVYTGNTRVNGGRIILAGGSDRLAPTSTVTLGQGTSSGVLQLGDASGASDQTLASLVMAGTGSANAVVGGHETLSILTIERATAVTYAGLLGGSGEYENNLGLTKSGAGTLTLSNDGNSFVGDVIVSGGILAITRSNALGTSPKSITISGTTN